MSPEKKAREIEGNEGSGGNRNKRSASKRELDVEDAQRDDGDTDFVEAEAVSAETMDGAPLGPLSFALLPILSFVPAEFLFREHVSQPPGLGLVSAPAAFSALTFIAAARFMSPEAASAASAPSPRGALRLWRY